MWVYAAYWQITRRGLGITWVFKGQSRSRACCDWLTCSLCPDVEDLLDMQQKQQKVAGGLL